MTPVVTPCGIELAIGQTWEEVGHRQHRTVLIAEIPTQQEGFDSRILISCCHRITKAQLKRFNGKRGGYRFVGNAL